MSRASASHVLASWYSAALMSVSTDRPFAPGGRRRSPAKLSLLLVLAAAALAACGSSGPSKPTESSLAAAREAKEQNEPSEATADGETASTATTTPATTQASTTAAAPDPTGPPAFAMAGSTESGDKVRIEGRFGPVLSPSESGVNQSALEGCPQYAAGRDLVVQVDLVTTIESGLSGDATAEGFDFTLPREVDYVLDFSEGATCKFAGEYEVSINMGTLQPHQPDHFTMWAVLLGAITPSDPHPSVQTLAHQHWSMAAPTVIADDAEVHFSHANPEIPLVK
jgi:predicted small lipoprotein YifL